MADEGQNYSVFNSRMLVDTVGDITDEAMTTVADCGNLRVLILDRTAIGDPGLEHLADMKHLQRLNIFGTQAGDGCIDVLEVLPSLTHVYLWDSKVTKSAAPRRHSDPVSLPSAV